MGPRAAAVAAALISLFAAPSCGVNPAPSAGGGGLNVPNQPPSIGLNAATVTDLLAAITAAGLAAPNPRDVSSQDCARIGCASETQTDTVSILVFPTSGRAQLYAGSTHNVVQLENVVLGFAASVPAGQRAAYEQAAARVIQ